MSPGGLGQKEPYAKHRVSLAPKQGTKNFQSLKPWSKGGKHGVKEEKTFDGEEHVYLS